jgi:predicted 3-demethylubiquinone-9 3-methyltransferase (glyoxalase superfamily)
MQLLNKITPFLSFHDQAEAAARFYVSIIPNSRIIRTAANPETGGVMTVEFELAGLRFVALNSGQNWKFTNAFSLSVACESQAEIDRLWSGLTADGGQEVFCGWLTDKFGLSWQIVPANIGDLLADPDGEKRSRVLGAMFQMVKLDMDKLNAAYLGK